MPKKSEDKGPVVQTEEDLDQVTGGGATPLIQSKLDKSGTTTTNFHGSDFNAAKNSSDGS